VKQPLVSVVVGTRNNTATLEACLASIAKQSYKNIELIVVDRDSTDDTKDIAKRFTKHVYNRQPERSVQRNYGVEKATGTYVVIIDSDMELTSGVIAACVEAITADPQTKGVIIPEESFGQGFWAQCKRLERSFYIGIDWIEAARFFRRETYLELGGYDTNLVSGEDWDLSQRVAQTGKLARVSDLIRHNEGHLQLFKTLGKKSHYAKKFTAYTNVKTPLANRNPYMIVIKRFGLYFSKPHKLFRNPVLGMGVLFMKVCEFGFGATGFWTVKKGQDEVA